MPRSTADSNRPGVVVDEPARSLDERLGKAGLALVYVGIALLFACIVLRGLATVRVPWGNMYEFINLTCSAVWWPRRSCCASRSTARCGCSCWFRC